MGAGWGQTQTATDAVALDVNNHSAAEQRAQILAARNGDAAGARYVFTWLGPAVRGYVRAQRGEVEADDLVNEVFLRVFRAASTFEGDATAFRSWVFTIAHNVVRDAARRARRRIVTTPFVDPGGKQLVGGDAERDAMSALSVRELQRVLGTLTGDQRDVVLLRVVADLSIEQIASALGKRPGAVKALQRRAHAVLRRELNSR